MGKIVAMAKTEYITFDNSKDALAWLMENMGWRARLWYYYYRSKYFLIKLKLRWRNRPIYKGQ